MAVSQHGVCWFLVFLCCWESRLGSFVGCGWFVEPDPVEVDDSNSVAVGSHTLKESNKRGDWMKQWLMMQKFVALNTMYRKTQKKKSNKQNPERCREAVGLHLDQQEIPEIQQKRRSKRHDTHGKRIMEALWHKL